MAKALLRLKNRELERLATQIDSAQLIDIIKEEVSVQRKLFFCIKVPFAFILKALGFVFDLFFNGRMIRRTEPGKYEEVSRYDRNSQY